MSERKNMFSLVFYETDDKPDSVQMSIEPNPGSLSEIDDQPCAQAVVMAWYLMAEQLGGTPEETQE